MTLGQEMYMTGLVGNSKDRFCHDAVQLILIKEHAYLLYENLTLMNLLVGICQIKKYIYSGHNKIFFFFFVYAKNKALNSFTQLHS